MLKNLKFNPLRPILAILLMAIPLYPKFPLFNVKNTYVAIRLDDILVALALLVWFGYQIKNRLPIIRQKITPLFVAYFLSIIASFITAFLVYQTTPANILLLHTLRRFEYISLFFITISTVKNLKDLKFLYAFLLITVIGICAYGYGQKYFSFPVVSTMNEEFSKGQVLQMDFWTRINSTFAGHYDLAAYLSVILIIIAGFFLTAKNKLFKIISFLIWIPAFHIFTLTASRVSTFAFWGGIVLTVVLLKKYLWVIPFSALIIFSIVNSRDLKQRLIATIPAFKIQIQKNRPADNTPTPTLTPTPTQAPVPSQKPSGQGGIIYPSPTPTPTVIRHKPQEEFIPIDTDVGVARSGEIRFNAEWPRAITAFRKNNLTGSGLGSITLATDNDYLRLLGESGILGFVSFMAILLFFIIKTVPLAFKKKHDYSDQLNIILLGGLLVTLANALFIDVFEASKTAYSFWIMMGIYYQTLKLSKKV